MTMIIIDLECHYSVVTLSIYLPIPLQQVVHKCWSGQISWQIGTRPYIKIDGHPVTGVPLVSRTVGSRMHDIVSCGPQYGLADHLMKEGKNEWGIALPWRVPSPADVAPDISYHIYWQWLEMPAPDLLAQISDSSWHSFGWFHQTSDTTTRVNG